jgi:hypothetical protein
VFLEFYKVFVSPLLSFLESEISKIKNTQLYLFLNSKTQKPLKPSLNYYVGLPATGRYHQPTPNLIKSKSLKITENTARSNSK